MKKTLAIANGIALIITIIINYLSNTGVFNGETMATMSSHLLSLFTPAGYAFSIWGLIYLGLIGFVFFQGRALSNNPEAETLVEQVGWWFFISCVANSCWVLAWLYAYTGLSVLIMILLLFALLKIVVRTNMELTDPPPRIIIFVWWPFCLYAGWISVALFANISAWLVKIEWTGLGIHRAYWAIIMIILAGVFHLFMTWRRNMREFAMVGVWALIAIGIADEDRAWLVSLFAFIMAGILFISSSIHAYKNRKLGPFRKRTVI